MSITTSHEQDFITLLSKFGFHSYFYTFSLTKACTLFRFPGFLPQVLLSQNPIQDKHCIWSSCLPKLLLAVAISQAFLVLDAIDSFEEYWSGIL